MEIRINTVLLATDFLQSSRLALDYAVAFAHSYRAKLKIVNVLDLELEAEAKTVESVHHTPSRTRRDAESRLQAFTSGIDKQGVSVEWALVEGSVPRTILKSISDYNADLLVIGTQGVHRGISHLLIGSNTEALMLSSPCPTLTIGPHVHGGIGLEPRFRTIVYISDFTPASAAAGSFAQALSKDLAAEVGVYQLLPEAIRNDPGQTRRVAEEYCAALAKVDPEIAQEWCTAEFHLGRIRRAEELRPKLVDPSALIVLGVEPASYLGRHLHTSFAYRLLADAACPVVTVPAKWRH